ncbi:uncharacterized protein LOC135481843 [Liolophura sinensis]|uniref:uncharacterized protein LOC135481843 n=1 Tax=Liolophura sinensis TaxID=3198878 RepID=UPI003158C115
MDTRVIFTKKGKLKHADGYNGDLDVGKDDSSEEDDVFIADPTIDINGSLTKPLMHPRHRSKPKGHRSRPCCRLLRPVLCFLLLVAAMGSLMSAVLYFVNHKNKAGDKLSSIQREDANILGCYRISSEDVWVVGIPKLITESAIRLVDVNQDGILDVITGFGTGADGYNIPDIVCDIYFNGTKPCHGGLLALEGLTGRELWRHYAPHEVFALNCNADLNGDGVFDCLGAGRAGVFQAVSGKEGRLLWNFGSQEAKNDIMNLYTPQYIDDLDGDDVIDILITHGGDPLQNPGSKHRLSGRLLILSGRTGKVLKWVGVPDKREVYYSPQIYQRRDASRVVLFGTGGETHPGSLWYITLQDLYEGNMGRAERIYKDEHKGVMTPPGLVDLTGDGVKDIVMAMFNSTVLAIDGETHKYLWNYSFPMSESYSTPAIGFYNNDSVPDFLVKYSFGPGFPLYYHAETTVLDGRTGESLLEQTIKDSVGAQASPLTISVQGHGNDIFLYWIADCKEHEGEGGAYKFIKGTNVHEQSRSDFCRLRFKTNGFSKLYALTSRVPVPGKAIYVSEDRKWVESSVWINTTQEALNFVRDHPEHLHDYLAFSAKTQMADEAKTAKRKGDGQNPLSARGPPIALGDAISTDYSSEPDSPQYGQLYDDDLGTDTEQLTRDKVYDALNRVLGEYESNGQGRYKPQSGSQGSGLGYGNYYQPTDRYGKDTVYKRSRTIHRKSEDETRSRSGVPKYIMRRKRRNAEGVSMGRNREPDQTSQFSQENILLTYKKLAAEKLARFLSEHEVGGARKKRHVGPHDEGGLQRLLSTGTVAPTTLEPDHPDYNHTADVVFATYWFFPAKTQAILPQDQHCIDQKLSQEKIRFDVKSHYYGMDHDAYEHAITDECLEESKHQLPNEGTYESQTSYNPYNVHMGQMTIYRIRVKCTCDQAEIVRTGKQCSRVLPFAEQQWAGYMGSHGDSHWEPRDWENHISILLPDV